MKQTRRQRRAKQTGMGRWGNGIGELVVTSPSLRGSSNKFPENRKHFRKKNQRNARSHRRIQQV